MVQASVADGGDTCGNISISGGKITAKGGYGAAGIGSGAGGTCGNITISGTASGIAKGGGGSPWDIGPGDGGACGTINVQENTIFGLASSGSYKINGLVDLSKLRTDYVVQDGDTLTGAIDNSYKISVAAGASITLKDASINADGANGGTTSLAGLTCLGDATITLLGENVVKGCKTGYPGIQAGPENTTLTIGGTGSLTATGGGLAAGIGSGKNGSCGNISITGGTITAMGLSGGAGIGSGENGSCGSISITGGTITASGSRLAAGIGSGYEGGCGDIIINGTASGQAEGDSNSPWDIGPGGEGGTCGTVSVQPGTISGSYPN